MEQDDSQKEPQIRGFDEGADILKAVKEYEVATDEKVVYGVYDNSKKGFWLKFNDFLIDHSKVSLKDKSYFFHMLAVMVDAGIPVVKAVKALSGRSENVRFRRILNTISYNIEHGTTFSDAMSRFEDVFDDAELGIIRSGEATGQLDVVHRI